MINRSLTLLLLIAISQLSCTESGPVLSVSQLQVIAPAPGRKASVAYMTIHNQGGAPAVLTGISSSQFARVELHQTVLKGGVARMQALGAVTIDANSSTDFVPGGRHVMLLDPTRALKPGDEVSLQFHFESGAILIVASPLRTRISVD
jgi:copper(I)-binding protein